MTFASETDFKQILRHELEQRIKRNPRYSLRAFAKDLKIAPPHLSDILNGKRGLSRDSASILGKRMNFSANEIEHFCDLVDSLHARSKQARTQAKERLNRKNPRSLKIQSISTDEFEVVSEGYHLAILELMKTEGYREEPKWIAKRLGLSFHQARQALNRLESVGLAKKENGRLRPSSDYVATPDGVPLKAMKLHHEGLIQKSIEALHVQPIEERVFRGLTIRCGKEDVPMVRERLRNFLLDLDRDLSASTEGNEVYQLNAQFFCLTREA